MMCRITWIWLSMYCFYLWKWARSIRIEMNVLVWHKACIISSQSYLFLPRCSCKNV